MNDSDGIDRLSIRNRPKGMPVMYQSWLKLLFMHWELPVEELRQHVPEPLQIDTFEGRAWIGITPFAVRNLRPLFIPPLPWLSNFTEINVRTYVHFRGVPGVWFFSLDADRFLAVLGARILYGLPYRYATMRMREHEGTIFCSSHRTSSPSATLSVGWRPGARIGAAPLGSLDFFLVERYCLYSMRSNRLFRARIYHEPWDLQRAELVDYQSTMLEAAGFRKRGGGPLLHHSDAQHVAVWPLEEAGK